MAEYIDIVGIKQAVNKGEMQAFVRDGSIYLQCKVSGECVKIGDAPAADVAPVVHGKWYHTGEVEWSCTNCGNVIATKDSWECPTKQYCDECGARMDGGKENAAD